MHLYRYRYLLVNKCYNHLNFRAKSYYGHVKEVYSCTYFKMINVCFDAE